MSYLLGIDVGASRVHAATARRSRSGADLIQVFQLGEASVDMPALVCATADGEFEYGEAAAARGVVHPEMLIGDIRQRIGTAVPFVVDGLEVAAEVAYALLISVVIEMVTAAEEEAPARVVVTHPATWKAHRLSLVRTALTALCPVEIELMPEPQAAILGADLQARPGEVVALYDLGGTTLDTALLRKAPSGWSDRPIASSSAAIGGIDVDDAIVEKVTSSAPAVADDSPDSRLLRDSLASVRTESVGAKEALSTWPWVSIPTHGGDGPLAVHLSQDDLATMIQGLLDRTFDALRATIDDAGLSVGDVSTVVLAGGSAHLPGLAERLSAALDVPVTTDTDPGSLIAVGGARAYLEQYAIDADPETGEDEPLSGDTEVAALMPDFIPPEHARLTTLLWRAVVTVLVIASAVYLVWTLKSGTAVPFGIDSHAVSGFGDVEGG